MQDKVNYLNILSEIFERDLNGQTPFEVEARQNAVQAVLYGRQIGDEKRQNEIRSFAAWIVKLADETKIENEKFLASLPTKVRRGWTKAYGKKNLVLFMRLMEIAGMEKCEIETFKDYVARGIPLTGSIPGCRFFRGFSENEAKKFQRKQDKNRKKCKPILKTPSGGPPKWAPEKANKDSWKAFKTKVIEKGLAEKKSDEEVKKLVAEGKALIIKAHPVQQGDKTWNEEDECWDFEKTRPCFDYRSGNTYIPTKYKLGFGAHALITQMLEAQISGQIISNGMNRKKAALQSIEVERQAWKNRSDLGEQKYTPEQKISNNEQQEPLLPGMAKTDKRSWYFQLPVRDDIMQIISIFNTDEDRWESYEMNCSVFGSLHSIFGACVFGETLAYILSTILKVPVTIYIDDLVYVSSIKTISLNKALAVLLMDLIGIELSTEKEDEMLAKGQAMKVLGFQYMLTKEIEPKVMVAPFPKRVENAIKTIRQTQEAIRKGALPHFVQIQSLIGTIVAIIFVDEWVEGVEVLQALFRFLREKEFQKCRKRQVFKRTLIFVLDEAVEIMQNAKPKVIPKADTRNCKKAITMTDASLDDKKAYIGGSRFTQAEKDFKQDLAFSIKVDVSRLPRRIQLLKPIICELELLAVLEMVERIIKGDEEKEITIYISLIDNSPAVISLTKGRCFRKLQLAIVSTICRRCRENGIKIIWSYIKSQRNHGDLFTRPERSDDILPVEAIDTSHINESVFDQIIAEVDRIQELNNAWERPTDNQGEEDNPPSDANSEICARGVHVAKRGNQSRSVHEMDRKKQKKTQQS